MTPDPLHRWRKYRRCAVSFKSLCSISVCTCTLRAWGASRVFNIILLCTDSAPRAVPEAEEDLVPARHFFSSLRLLEGGSLKQIDSSPPPPHDTTGYWCYFVATCPASLLTFDLFSFMSLLLLRWIRSSRNCVTLESCVCFACTTCILLPCCTIDTHTYAKNQMFNRQNVITTAATLCANGINTCKTCWVSLLHLHLDLL